MKFRKTRIRVGKLKGYKTPGYSWSKSISRFKKTGYFKVRQHGEGHRAGYRWGDDKGIDPASSVKRYGKNSPSFDEGVYAYKESRKKSINKAADKLFKSI